MSRPPVSVIVTASGTPNDFRACLETLRPTLGVRDEVVCVVPAGRADLGNLLRQNTWITGFEDESGCQATRWTVGLAATSHPVVVLLDGDVLVSAHWLDSIIEPFADPDVVAAGPRCHRSYGPQSAVLPAEALDRVATFKTYARQWRQEHAGRFTEADRLGTVCVAIRRDALARAGGPTVDLPYEELRSQGRLVVAQGALVAHVGSDECVLHLPDVPADAPLLSASMIVKDEEDVLASCLSALRDFVDEIVVYDTGSTDRTRDIAREHGARVIEGYWNDHFGDARNRSLEHCQGQWILYVDADEVVTGDPDKVRAQLRSTAASALAVGVESLMGHGTGMYGRQLYPRLFQRNRGRFVDRVHEQVVDRVNGDHIPSPDALHLTLLHSGYTVGRTTLKDKGERNLRLAQMAAVEQEDRPWALVNLARSQILANRFEDTIDTCQKALATVERPYRALFLRSLIEAYERLGRLEDARIAINELRQVSESSVTADELEARLCVLEGDFAGALAIVETFPETAVDEFFIVVDRSRVAGVEILALFGLRRYHEAAERLRDCVRKERLPLAIAKMAEILESDDSSITELAVLLARPALRGLLLLASEAPDALADDVFETLWQQHGAVAMVLASAARIGGRLPVLRAMEWSARLRQHGFSEHCTLLTLAANHMQTPRNRAVAAAIALELFSDDRAMPLLEDALGAVPDHENDRVLQDLRQLAPTIAAAIEPANVG